MAIVRLKGLNKKTRTLADGRRVTYWWAWKGGPSLPGRPGDPEFMAAYNAAVTDRRTPKGKTLAILVARYRASPEYAKLADSTKAHWATWLDRIAETESELAIGGLPIAALDDRRVKTEILEWRDQWAHAPRTADYAMQVLSRVLGWSVGRGALAINAAEGVEQLYVNNRADQIWTPAEIAAYEAAAPSPEVMFIVPLACVTGLRRDDLAKLLKAQVGDVAIVQPTGKSTGAKDAVVPLIAESRALLKAIGDQQARRHAALTARALRKGRPPPPEPLTVLTNTRGKPWTVNGLEHQVIDTKTTAGVYKHLHDARGTFGTRLRKAGLAASEIADVLGWEEDRVERLLSTYVDRNDIVTSIARRIAQNEAGPKTPD